MILLNSLPPNYVTSSWKPTQSKYFSVLPKTLTWVKMVEDGTFPKFRNMVGPGVLEYHEEKTLYHLFSSKNYQYK
jgi:hypothetical protein